jgi:3-oxoacyl-[acyl-carrier protein] reductase
VNVIVFAVHLDKVRLEICTDFLSTKGSIDIITQVLANELGPKKIRVNSINPGGTETEGAHGLGVRGRRITNDCGVARFSL